MREGPGGLPPPQRPVHRATAHRDHQGASDCEDEVLVFRGKSEGDKEAGPLPCRDWWEDIHQVEEEEEVLLYVMLGLDEIVKSSEDGTVVWGLPYGHGVG